MLSRVALLSAVMAASTMLALTGCGAAAAPADQPPMVAPNVSVPTDSPDSGGGGGRVSANSASEEELVAALTRAGVSNPQRWAHEIEEYRPYPAQDPALGKLRAELTKYNPGQETLDRIVSALTP